MNERGERESKRHRLIDEYAPMSCAERGHSEVCRSHRGNVINPVNREALECIIALGTVHVLDEACHFHARDVRCHIRDFRREAACAEDE